MQMDNDFPDEHFERLNPFCEERKISRDEAVAQVLEKNTPKQPEVGFEAWRNKRVDPGEYIDGSRGEWR